MMPRRQADQDVSFVLLMLAAMRKIVPLSPKPLTVSYGMRHHLSTLSRAAVALCFNCSHLISGGQILASVCPLDFIQSAIASDAGDFSHHLMTSYCML